MNQSEDVLLLALKNQIDALSQGRPVVLNESALPFSDNPLLEQLKQSIVTLSHQYVDNYTYIMDLSKGKLDVQAPKLNNCSTPFKALQAQLLHLTWQIQQISEGDLEQKVSFSGDFSNAMNRMIKALRQKRHIDRLNEKYVQELKEVNATKDRFFSIIAHDLKNPFYGLLGMSDILLDTIRSEHTEELETLTLQLRYSAEQGYKLLLNLLEWSRIQTGKLEINTQTTTLKPILNEVLELLKSVAIQKRINLNLDCADDIQVVTDVNVLMTVLRNLVSNALKFTRPEGTVDVRAVQKSNYVQLTVTDDGVGMSPKILENLFKLDASVSMPGTNNERGTGLGLILCKELLRKMGSDVRVKSEEGKGSVFRFRLNSPIQQANE